MLWGRLISGTVMAAGVVGAFYALEQHQAAGVLERDMAEYRERFNRESRESFDPELAELRRDEAIELSKRAQAVIENTPELRRR